MNRYNDNGLNLVKKPDNLVVESNEAFDQVALLEIMARLANENPRLRFTAIPHVYYEAVVEAKENPD